VNNVPRRRRWPVIVVIAAVSAAVLPFATASRSRASAAVTASVQGVGSQQPGIAYERTRPLATDLAAIEASGMTWVRADFFWSTIQANGRSSFDWAPTDAFVRAAKAHHLHVLALVAYTPPWARHGGTSKNPPVNPADYANFVHAAAQRYGPMGVHDWEIWNEPNTAMFWAPKADPVAYATLLRAAYPAIKSADRNATVITGGMAPARNGPQNIAPASFLADIYFHGAKGHFDAVGLHPYSYPYPPMYNASWNTFYTTPDLHKIMQGVGDGAKQIWGTEIGYPTGSGAGSVSEGRQSQYLLEAVTAWHKWSFTGPLFIFLLRDTSTSKADLEGNMGLLRWNGKPKPAYAALRRKLAG
jgi:hypothetical protein